MNQCKTKRSAKIDTYINGYRIETLPLALPLALPLIFPPARKHHHLTPSLQARNLKKSTPPLLSTQVTFTAT
jgi:hypothetical protein